MCGLGGILRVLTPESASYAAARRAYDNNDSTADPHEDDAWSIPSAWLETLDSAVAHRGPDGSGFYRDQTLLDDGRLVEVALVHRRLTIIDPAGGATHGRRTQAVSCNRSIPRGLAASRSSSTAASTTTPNCVAPSNNAANVSTATTPTPSAAATVAERRETGRLASAPRTLAREGLSPKGCTQSVCGTAMGTVHLARPVRRETDAAGMFNSGDGDTVGVFASTAAAIAELIAHNNNAQHQPGPHADGSCKVRYRDIAVGRSLRTPAGRPPVLSPPSTASNSTPTSQHSIPTLADDPKVQTPPDKAEPCRICSASIEKRLDADVPVACLLSGGIDSHASQPSPARSNANAGEN